MAQPPDFLYALLQDCLVQSLNETTPQLSRINALFQRRFVL